MQQPPAKQPILPAPGEPYLIGGSDAHNVASTTVSEITRIMRKRSAGHELTASEREYARNYYARYARRKTAVHLKGPREQQYREQAAAKGMSLSAWIQEQVDISLLPNPREALLVDENQKLRDEVAALRGASGSLAVENSRLQIRMEALEGNLMEAVEQALHLQEA